ncbi:MAG: helix-turn-helix transcriptional regulator [Paenibacillus sp.]|uniref:helix-turn-helix transcriptional regulator n=1 Tax=Paenibacillus aquistagni TaxID=1852522 RepID=UPI000A1CCF37|nr:helix-turn-helix transcriptional regulator [Paenibacillus aquistagni]MBR2569460.1 helix-turn-helix transcriptional regulator [Paenibacillus sp.]NMM52576.1 helix-turn-helix transcriptional regulator [Paenibacillus aquistagni]
MEIIHIVKRHAPITAEQIAEMLNISRPTIRGDLSLLVMLDYLAAKPKVGYFLGQKSDEPPVDASQLHSTKVRDVQGVPIVVDVKTTVQDAVVALFLENVGSLIVTTENGTLAGVISRKDLLKVTLGNPQAGSMPVSMVMTRQANVITVTPEDSVLEAAKKMIHYHIDSLPVVQENSQREAEQLEVVGRITKTTIIKVMLEKLDS